MPLPSSNHFLLILNNPFKISPYSGLQDLTRSSLWLGSWPHSIPRSPSPCVPAMLASLLFFKYSIYPVTYMPVCPSLFYPVMCFPQIFHGLPLPSHVSSTHMSLLQWRCPLTNLSNNPNCPPQTPYLIFVLSTI